MKQLSIIIPHYNSPESLEKLISSIPQYNWIHILVIDDNSQIPLIEDNYQHKNLTFYTLPIDKKGAGAARNLGLKHCTSDWVLFADADDFYLEGAFKKVEPYLETKLESIYFIPTSMNNKTLQKGKRHLGYEKLLLQYLKTKDKTLLFRFFVPWSKLISMNLIKDNCIKFDEIIASNDLNFSLQVALFSQKTLVSTNSIYCVTESSNSLISQVTEPVIDSRFKAICDYNDFISTKGYPNKKLSTNLPIYIARKIGIKKMWKMTLFSIKHKHPLLRGIKPLMRIILINLTKKGSIEQEVYMTDKKKNKVIYIKGGEAVKEAHKLFPCEGKELNFGPDQYLLNVMKYSNYTSFRVITLNAQFKVMSKSNKQAVEFPLRIQESNKLKKIITLLFRYLNFIWFNIKWKPNLILCGVEGNISLLAVTIAKLSGAKIIFLGHNALNLKQTPKHTKLFNRLSLKFTNAAIVHGPFIKDQVLSLNFSKKKIFEFLTAVKPQEKNTVQTKPLYPNKNLLLYVGRIEANKGVFDLLNAFNRINSTDNQLVFIGEGSDLKQLQKESSESNVAERVALLGKVEHQQVFNYMQQAFVTITPTLSSFPEGRCMSVVESLLVHTPIIAPNFGPFPYLVKDNINGLLYEPDNIEGLANKVNELIENKSLYNSLIEGTKDSAKELLQPYKEFKTSLIDAITFVQK